MADRFDEVTIPLVIVGLMSSRGVALNLRKRIPIHIRRVTMSAMRREDQKRAKSTDPLVNKDELINIAQEEEGFLPKFEAEMRAAGQVTDPRPMESKDVLPSPTKASSANGGMCPTAWQHQGAPGSAYAGPSGSGHVGVPPMPLGGEHRQELHAKERWSHTRQQQQNPWQPSWSVGGT